MECGGTDSYTNAISDTYQDNFNEGIYTGKGVYDVEIFDKVLENQIPENKVLSHDLLEGSYLRCGLCSDVVLMDGYPTNYLSFKTRMHRWIRGDIQICSWLMKRIKDKNGNVINNPLNILSKYKILDNIFRCNLEIACISSLVLYVLVSRIYGIKIWRLCTINIFCCFYSKYYRYSKRNNI